MNIPFWIGVLVGIILVCAIEFVAEVVRCLRGKEQSPDEYQTINLPLKSL